MRFGLTFSVELVPLEQSDIWTYLSVWTNWCTYSVSRRICSLDLLASSISTDEIPLKIRDMQVYD